MAGKLRKSWTSAISLNSQTYFLINPTKYGFFRITIRVKNYFAKLRHDTLFKMLYLSINEKRPSRRDRSPRVDTTTSNFSVPSGGGVGVIPTLALLMTTNAYITNPLAIMKYY